jgi:hypothetical protein
MMTIEHAFEPGPGHLAVRVSGSYSLPAIRGLIEAVGAEVERGGYAHALIDITALQGDQPDMDRFEMGVHAAEHLASLDRLAVLVNQALRVNHFFEDVARNRGLQVLVTKDPGEALAWLTSP